MDIINDFCHWCESPISRTLALGIWLDEEGSGICLFHPANFDARNMKATGESAYHFTIEEVHDIIIAEHHRRKAIRAKQPLHSVKDNVVMLSKNARKTSRAAARKLEPNSGTIRFAVYTAIKDNYGLTDSELETLLRGKHQTVSASRRSLVIDGYIIDSGSTRKNPQGNDCIVWVVNTNMTQEALL